MIDGYVTVRQTAEMTGYTVSGIRNLLRADKIDGATRLGREWAIPKAWAEGHTKPLTVAQQARDMGISRETYYKRKKKEQKK